jgi:hypothetical protein
MVCCASSRARVALATVATFGMITIFGAYQTIRDYFDYKDLKGLGGPAEVWAWRYFLYWFFLALAVSLGVLVCQLAYEWLIPRRHTALVIVLSVALPCVLPIFSILAYLPDFHWWIGPPEPAPMQTWSSTFCGIVSILIVNLLRERKNDKAVA